MNISEVRKVVGKLKASLFKRANSHSVGVLKTNVRGTGLQFKEHQVYNHGDDVRFIDWKILAKTSHPYVKTFVEERNVEIVVVIDASPTMLTGINGVSKLQAAIEICCLLYLIAKETNDLVHALIVTEDVINVPKLSGDKGITQLISILEDHNILTKDGKVNISRNDLESLDNKKKYNAIMKHLSRKREIVLLSDFNNFISEEMLKRFLIYSNVKCFQLLSPIDEAKSLPFSLYVTFGARLGRGFGKFNLSQDKPFDGMFGKKLVKLRVKEKYLENFIKEMR